MKAEVRRWTVDRDDGAQVNGCVMEYCVVLVEEVAGAGFIERVEEAWSILLTMQTKVEHHQVTIIQLMGRRVLGRRQTRLARYDDGLLHWQV